MKAVYIIYNQSLTEEVQEILDKLSMRGYTQWTGITGRGSVKGDPHKGTHTWPELNNAHLTIIEDTQIDALLNKLKSFNKGVEEQGLRAFVWDIVDTV